MNVGFVELNNEGDGGKTINDQYTSRDSNQSKEGTHEAIRNIGIARIAYMPGPQKSPKRFLKDSST